MNVDIVESFSQMVREKGIDKDVLGGIIEEIFGLLVRKKYGEEAKFDVVVNMDKGDIEIFLEREIVDQVEIAPAVLAIAVDHGKHSLGFAVLPWSRQPGLMIEFKTIASAEFPFCVLHPNPPC